MSKWYNRIGPNAESILGLVRSRSDLIKSRTGLVYCGSVSITGQMKTKAVLYHSTMNICNVTTQLTAFCKLIVRCKSAYNELTERHYTGWAKKSEPQMLYT